MPQDVEISSFDLRYDGCRMKLGISVVPYHSLGDDEAFGIIQLIRISNSRTISILEQAMLIDELRNVYKMTVSDIAERIEKSRAWVSMRTGLMDEMSEGVKRSIFNGKFPAYACPALLKPFG